MKKSILFLFTICFGFNSYSQYITQGFHPEALYPYAVDFVTSKKSSPNLVFYEQKKKSDPSQDTIVFVKSDSISDPIAGTCVHRLQSFKYSLVRDTISHSIKYSMSQPYGSYEPVVVGFDGKTLNISKGNSSIYFQFKNTSDSSVFLNVSLQDNKNKFINSLPKYGTRPIHDIYKDEVRFGPIAPGETIDHSTLYKEINFSKSMYPKSPYFGSYLKDYCSREVMATRDSSFDYTNLSAVLFTVTSATNIGPIDSYKPFKFNGTFEISKFKIDGSLLTGLKEETDNLTNSLTVYPNPVSDGVLNLSTETKNIKIIDVFGNTMMSGLFGKTINVSNLSKGVYTLQSSDGFCRFIVK